PAVAVEVAGRRAGGRLPNRQHAAGVERAVAKPEEDRGSAISFVAHHRVEPPIAVEITCRDSGWTGARGPAWPGAEATFAIARQNEQPACADGDVELRVTIEVAHGEIDGAGPSATLGEARGVETSVAAAAQEARIATHVDQVETSVSVEVSGTDRMST